MHGGHETAKVGGVLRTDRGRRLREGGGKKGVRCPLDDLVDFGINADEWKIAAQDEGEWRRNKGRNVSRRYGIVAESGLDFGTQ